MTHPFLLIGSEQNNFNIYSGSNVQPKFEFQNPEFLFPKTEEKMKIFFSLKQSNKPTQKIFMPKVTSQDTKVVQIKEIYFNRNKLKQKSDYFITSIASNKFIEINFFCLNTGRAIINVVISMPGQYLDIEFSFIKQCGMSLINLNLFSYFPKNNEFNGYILKIYSFQYFL